MTRPVLVWFGRDLRLDDHPALACLEGRPALLVYALDGVQTAVSVAAKQIGGSAITTDTTNSHLYRIDWSNNSDIVFYVDGNRVNAVGSVTWTATAGANSVMQPWAEVYKAAGTGVGTLTIDKIDMLNSR